MAFWIASGVISLSVALLVTLGLLRRAGTEDSAAQKDLAVYRDQLREVDRDIERGVLSAADAERLRIEISRRILDADRKAARAGARSDIPAAARWGGLAVVPLMIAGSFLIYDQIGAPGYPDMPLQARLDAARELRATRPTQAVVEAEMQARADIERERTGQEPPAPQVSPQDAELVEQLRSLLEHRPDDLQGHRLLASSEASLGNFTAAHRAQANVIRILGDDATPEDYVFLADMLISAAGGYVSPEAERALESALRRDPRNPMARFFSGLMLAQTERPDLAFHLWRQLLDESEPDAPWVQPIRSQIEWMAMRAGVNYTLPPEGTRPAQRGPTSEDIAAMADMDPEDRDAMIEGMVGGLAARLAAEGGTPDEWAQLIAAYAVLGDHERAQAIFAEAQVVFAENTDALAPILAAARQVGLIQ